MHEIALQYLGKKSPFKLTNPNVGTVVFGSEPVWLPVRSAEWLTKTNPKMFSKVGERGQEELIEDATDMIKAKKDTDAEDDALLESAPPAPDEEPAEVKSNMACPTCGKEYKDKVWLDKHVAKCEG